MLFWFIATSIWSVWYVFRDPKFDYRLLAIASLIPDVLDGLVGLVGFVGFAGIIGFGGGAGPFHSVVTSVVVLFGIMLATFGRRPIRQRLLAIPIGMFMHLIFDGAFTDAKIFWWPLTGTNIPGTNILGTPLPSLERGIWNIPLEIIGGFALIIAWRYFSLSDASRRRLFLGKGKLSRDKLRDGKLSDTKLHDMTVN
ncbi:MAG: hypothetical protein HQ486_06660 [Acidimicrobiaceae bacterium]|nr:hypothetical protein [Acidimicrobiaceae bacterium]